MLESEVLLSAALCRRPWSSGLCVFILLCSLNQEFTTIICSLKGMNFKPVTTKNLCSPSSKYFSSVFCWRQKVAGFVYFLDAERNRLMEETQPARKVCEKC